MAVRYPVVTGYRVQYLILALGMLNGQMSAKCLRVSNVNLVCFMAGPTGSSVNINIVRFDVFCTCQAVVFSNDVL